MIFNKYIEAMELSAPKEPNLAFLNTFTIQHIERFTFNNLAVLLCQDILLDLPAIFNKVVLSGAGGYCFEHNKLAYEALSHWGFNVRLLLARVINNNERPVPRTHRITLVELNQQRYLIDVGFGAACPTAPIHLDNPLPQQAGFEHYQIQTNDHGEFELWQCNKDGPFLLYRFDLAQYTDADCELGHFYSHKHPNAAFKNNLVVSKKTSASAISIANQRLKYSSASSTNVELIESSKALFEILTNLFQLQVEQAVCEFLFEHLIAPKIEHSKV